MGKLRAAIIRPNMQYEMLFQLKGWDVLKEADYQDADLVQFTGGEDVSPYMYKEAKAPRTYSNSFRDENEKKIFENCVKYQIPMAGICRGGQFLNVMNGGRMLQHIEGHGKDHMVQDIFDNWYWASSTHHQMMLRHPDGTLVAWATEGYPKFSFFHGEYRETDEITDTEVVFYEKTQTLCFQPHAEFSNKEYDELSDIYFEYIYEFLVQER